MKVIQVPIDSIKPYKDNPRKIGQDAIDKVAESIKAFGFQQPIVVDKNNIIIVGHTRLKAAQALGLKEVPVIIADKLTEAQAAAYRLADNKTGEFSKWDEELLEKELIELENMDFDMESFGFDIDREMPDLEEDDFQEDEEAEIYVKQGEIYQLGKHRLMCGDSTKKEDVERLTGGVRADLALTDPPYGVSIVRAKKVGSGGELHFGTVGGANETHFGHVGGGLIVDSREYMPVKGDDSTDTARESYAILKEITDNQIIFGGNYFTDFLPPRACWLVWDKQINGSFADVELAWVNSNRAAKLYKWLWNGLCREGSRDVEGKTRVHPTQKPVGLIGNILNDFSEEGDTIIDLFGGSGSTLIACEQLNRTCFMMEYEPYYIQVIIDRWEKLTGNKAVKIS